MDSLTPNNYPPPRYRSPESIDTSIFPSLSLPPEYPISATQVQFPSAPPPSSSTFSVISNSTYSSDSNVSNSKQNKESFVQKIFGLICEWFLKIVTLFLLLGIFIMLCIFVATISNLKTVIQDDLSSNNQYNTFNNFNPKFNNN